MQIGEWKGKSERMESIYVDALKFDDYILADYVNSHRDFVNFYVAYYGDQQQGAGIHSPRTCIPGGGWEIKDLSQRVVDGVSVNGQPLKVNRVVIAKGDMTQLVYYWFEQRGRILTNEYAVRWYLLVDALERNRTDGALVRLTTSMDPTERILPLAIEG